MSLQHKVSGIQLKKKNCSDVEWTWVGCEWLVGFIARTTVGKSRRSSSPPLSEARQGCISETDRIDAIDRTLLSVQLLESQPETSSMRIADLILPVFAVILTGWIVGYTGYLSRALSDGLIHFAYNIAMPALLIVTIAQEPSHSLINWRFLVAFGGGSLLCFILVFGIMSIHASRSLASRTMYGMAASMTNTGFVALPILQAIYGPRAVLPAAIATVFVAVVMFPIAVILLELGQRDAHGSRTAPMVTVKHVVLNPMVISTLIGMLCSVLGLRMPGPVTAYLGILADALTPCALFAIGLGLSIDGLRANIGRASLLSVVKLVIMPLIVYGLSVAWGSTRSTPLRP